MSYSCPECKGDTIKVRNEYVNFQCKKCLKKWTIVDLQNIPRSLIDRLVKDEDFVNKVRTLGPEMEKGSV